MIIDIEEDNSFAKISFNKSDKEFVREYLTNENIKGLIETQDKNNISDKDADEFYDNLTTSCTDYQKVCRIYEDAEFNILNRLTRELIVVKKTSPDFNPDLKNLEIFKSQIRELIEKLEELPKTTKPSNTMKASNDMKLTNVGESSKTEGPEKPEKSPEDRCREILELATALKRIRDEHENLLRYRKFQDVDASQIKHIKDINESKKIHHATDMFKSLFHHTPRIQ